MMTNSPSYCSHLLYLVSEILLLLDFWPEPEFDPSTQLVSYRTVELQMSTITLKYKVVKVILNLRESKNILLLCSKKWKTQHFNLKKGIWALE